MLEIKQEKRINATDLYELLSVSFSKYFIVILFFILISFCIKLNIKDEKEKMEE
jgi:hypothetical protein